MRFWDKIKQMLLIRKQAIAKGLTQLEIKKGQSLAEEGRHQQALECYNRVLAIDAQNFAAWSFKGHTLLKMGKYKEAREAFRKFIENAPTNYKKHVAEIKQLMKDIERIE